MRGEVDEWPEPDGRRPELQAPPVRFVDGTHRSRRNRHVERGPQRPSLPLRVRLVRALDGHCGQRSPAACTGCAAAGSRSARPRKMAKPHNVTRIQRSEGLHRAKHEPTGRHCGTLRTCPGHRVLALAWRGRPHASRFMTPATRGWRTATLGMACPRRTAGRGPGTGQSTQGYAPAFQYPSHHPAAQRTGGHPWRCGRGTGVQRPPLR